MPPPNVSVRHSSEALNAVTRLLSASLDTAGPAALHQLLVDEARALFGATGAVLLSIEERERLAHVVCSAPSQPTPNRRLQLDALPALAELTDQRSSHVLLSTARTQVLGRLLGWSGATPSAMVLPLRSRDRLEHALVLRGPHFGWGTDPDTVSVATAFAAAAGAAVAQARLGAEQATRMAQQAALSRAGRQLNDRGLDLPAVLHGICAEAQAILDGDCAIVYRKDTDDSLTVEACLGLPDGTAGRRLPISTGLSGRVVSANRALLTNDYDQLAQPSPGTPFDGIRSCLSVPLRWDGELRGVLSVGFRRTQFVDPRDLALLEAFGELAAAACRNASTAAGLARAARTDGLTGCLNQSALRELLRDEVARSERTGVPVSIILLDLDEFKEVNERAGHLTGDEVLRRVGDALRASVRPYDAVARYGGDEFVIICPGADEPAALEVAHRALDRVEAGVRSLTGTRGTAATAGVAQLRPGQPVLGLLDDADRALLYGKQELDRGVAVRASDLPASWSGAVDDRHASRLGDTPIRDVIGAAEEPRAQPGAAGHGTGAGDAQPWPSNDSGSDAERSRLEKRTRQLSIARALGTRLAGISDPDAIPDAVVDELHRAFGYFLCAAVRLREDDYVEAVAVRGDNFVRLLVDQWTQPRDAGLIGRSLRARRAIVVDDVLLDSTYATTIATHEVRSEMVAPVWVGDKLWGVLNVEELRPRAFDENDVQLLEMLADQLGAALRSATLYAQLERAYLGTAEALAAALEAKDAYTASHAHSIVDWADRVGERLGMSADERRDLRYGAIFHDIGKIAVPEAILNKRGPLDVTEATLVRRHTIVGEQILAPVEFLSGVLPIVRHEHERWDGGGYPDGLAGREIPLSARVVFVCDAYHAMTSDRPYRQAMAPDAARAELAAGAGTQFDPAVVAAFLAVLDDEQRAPHLVAVS
ncbi:GAF domain-containing protein [Paraconexibacter antarcticus]|uniref:GAF domain-containing protein n=1 Tax=Paraconexibacter antarcticus TaxID=2949664 RepID=A0ABY5DT77_9ACTN|nr:HD domain-containing phosphohydrolase [Paraconexibacter antarcticus]UTI64022.1 GAF domain-containing protein [Paraconexibacter antarcticus]